MENKYIISIFITLILMFIFAIIYLYKNNNKFIINLLLKKYTHINPKKIKRSNKVYDLIVFISLICFIIILGMKYITFMIIISDSMKPEFQRGDMILTQSFDINPEVGDIITFYPDNKYITISHRILRIEDNRIITKGDAYNQEDRYIITKNDIISKAILLYGHPIVIKKVGAYFITDYTKGSTTSGKYGDQFNFIQQLFLTIRTWGYLITIIALLFYISTIIKHT